MPTVKSAAAAFELYLLAGAFVVLAISVVIAFAYELQTKRRMP